MIVTRTPYRCSLFGGSTDQPAHFLTYGGAVLTTTLDQSIDIICYPKEMFGQVATTVQWSQGIEQVATVDDIRHDLVREAMRFLGIAGGIELHMRGSITSQGTGLGSSSAACVGILHALHQFLGDSVPAEQLAKEAVHIEHHVLGRPVGPQDHYAAAHGGILFLHLRPTGAIEVEKLRLSEEVFRALERRLLLFFTGQARSAADSLAAQAASAHQPEQIAIRQAMTANAYQAKQRLEAGDIDGVGLLLDREWELKRKLSLGITTKSIDRAYTAALAAGATGGKLLGAGGGGFLLLYVPPAQQAAVRQDLRDLGLVELPFRFSHHGSAVLVRLPEDSRGHPSLGKPSAVSSDRYCPLCKESVASAKTTVKVHSQVVGR